MENLVGSELFDQLLPFVLMGLAAVLGWGVGKLNAFVAATPTDIDDKILAAVKKALTDDKTV